MKHLPIVVILLALTVAERRWASNARTLQWGHLHVVGNNGLMPPVTLLTYFSKRISSQEVEEVCEEDLHKMLYTRVGRRKRSGQKHQMGWNRITRDGRNRRSGQDMDKMLYTRVG